MKSFYPHSYLLLVIIAFSAISCTNSVSDHEEEHSEPFGYSLVMGNFIIAESMPGEEPVNEFPVLTTGEESQEIEAFFYDFEGNIFQPDEPEQSLFVEAVDDQMLQINPGDSKWTFSISPLSAGSTSIIINLMHDDHPDFTSDSISVQVKSPKN